MTYPAFRESAQYNARRELSAHLSVEKKLGLKKGSLAAVVG